MKQNMSNVLNAFETSYKPKPPLTPVAMLGWKESLKMNTRHELLKGPPIHVGFQRAMALDITNNQTRA